MKRVVIATAVFFFGTVLATASFALGRHDEKPHGSGKPAAGAIASTSGITGGRHDERPHGPKQSAGKAADVKKEAAKPGAAAAQ